MKTATTLTAAAPLAVLALDSMLAASPAAASEETTDLELVLALDGSSSIDIGEYGLQLRGIRRRFREKLLRGLAPRPLSASIASEPTPPRR